MHMAKPCFLDPTTSIPRAILWARKLDRTIYGVLVPENYEFTATDIHNGAVLTKLHYPTNYLCDRDLFKIIEKGIYGIRSCKLAAATYNANHRHILGDSISRTKYDL